MGWGGFENKKPRTIPDPFILQKLVQWSGQTSLENSELIDQSREGFHIVFIDFLLDV